MCTCNAFSYRSCQYGHCRFEPVDVCLAARLGVRDKCQERIINGKEGLTRAWPTIDEICPFCFPEKAVAEEKKKTQKREADGTTYSAFSEPSMELFPSASDFEPFQRHCWESIGESRCFLCCLEGGWAGVMMYQIHRASRVIFLPELASCLRKGSP